MPLAREVVKDLAVEHGACIRPIQLRRTNLDTGEADTVLVPCGHTLAHGHRRHVSDNPAEKEPGAPLDAEKEQNRAETGHDPD